MTELIVWFTIENKVDAKKHKFIQFWIEAKDNKTAINEAVLEATKLKFVPKILGISKYKNLSWEASKMKNHVFQNKTFH